VTDDTTHLYRDFAYQVIYRRTQDHALSEDLSQDTFIRLLRYRGRAIANLRGLARTIAENLIRDHFRSDNRRAEEALTPANDQAAEQPSQFDQLRHRQRLEKAERVLASLPPLRREVLIRRRLHGQPSRQVGEELDISPAAVDQHVARALLSLHDKLRDF
jgi:RNA polymerase sigma-70 factor (ECF subfamily)